MRLIKWANHIFIFIRNNQIFLCQFCFFQYKKEFAFATLNKSNMEVNTFENSRSDCSFAFISSVSAADIQKTQIYFEDDFCLFLVF